MEAREGRGVEPALREQPSSCGRRSRTASSSTEVGGAHAGAGARPRLRRGAACRLAGRARLAGDGGRLLRRRDREGAAARGGARRRGRVGGGRPDAVAAGRRRSTSCSSSTSSCRAAERRRDVARGRARSRPAGRSCSSAHDSRNLEERPRRPEDPPRCSTRRRTSSRTSTAAGSRSSAPRPVRRPVETPEGERVAIDALVRARRLAEGGELLGRVDVHEEPLVEVENGDVETGDRAMEGELAALERGEGRSAVGAGSGPRAGRATSRQAPRARAGAPA